MPERRKIIIDCDPGVDDALAIALAVESPDLEVIGITTSYGNAPVELTTKNALRIVELSGREIPVARGARGPLASPQHPSPTFIHGHDGLGNTNQPEPGSVAVELSAWRFIVDSIRKYPGEVTLVPLAGLTNLALVLQEDPEAAQLVQEVTLMGGSLRHPGNVGPVSEANIAQDPPAADRVFTAPWKVNMVGLDVTMKLVMENAFLEKLRAGNRRFGAFLHDIHQFYIGFYRKERGLEGCAVHDSAAILRILDPTLFELVEGPLRVVQEGIASGQTVMAHYAHQREMLPWRDKPWVSAALDVHQGRFFEKMEEILLAE